MRYCARLCLVLMLLASACAPAPEVMACGPETARVVEVIDGDTVVLSSGQRLRYLLVDTPEIADCYGQQAAAFNRSLVEGRDVTLSYEGPCRDRYNRLLAHVTVGAQDVTRRLVELGFGCVFYVPPLARDRVYELSTLEEQARGMRRGLWGACSASVCM